MDLVFDQFLLLFTNFTNIIGKSEKPFEEFKKTKDSDEILEGLIHKKSDTQMSYLWKTISPKK